MSGQDVLIETSYYDLVECYSMEHSCAFLQTCWLLGENESFSSKSFSRMVFSDGNRREIYTKRERDFITSVKAEVFYSCCQKQFRQGVIECYMVSIDISLSFDPLYDAIEFMKIFNKAFDGFNVFLFVCDEGTYIGCSCIKSNEIARDCVISPLITSEINWESLGNELLCRNDSNDFFEYYLGIIYLVNEIRYCFNSDNSEEYPIFSSPLHQDIDPADEFRKVKIDDYINMKLKKNLSELKSFDEDLFDCDLKVCFDDLEFIKTSRVNSLEMLFEAEKVLEQNSIPERHHTMVFAQELDEQIHFNTKENLKLLDDPIALIKKLKQEISI